MSQLSPQEFERKPAAKLYDKIYRSIYINGLDFPQDLFTGRILIDPVEMEPEGDSISCHSKADLDSYSYLNPWDMFRKLLPSRNPPDNAIIVFEAHFLHSVARLKYYSDRKPSPLPKDKHGIRKYAHIALLDSNFNPPSGLAFSSILDYIQDNYHIVSDSAVYTEIEPFPDAVNLDGKCLQF